MNRDLMLAVLAMDAYDTKGNVGFATNLNTKVTPEMKAAGFNAQAYSYAGETIISYRGTDGYYFGDAWYGWGTGLGTGSTQATMAA